MSTSTAVTANDVDEPLVHDVLMPGKRGKYEPVLIVNQIKRVLDDLPPTKTTTITSELAADTDYEPQAITQEMMYFVGSWQASKSNDYIRWVNPTAAGRVRYSDALVECDCGVYVAQARPFKANESPHDDTIDVHEDDCILQDRLRARARLCERRATIIREMMPLGWTLRELSPRLGFGSIYTAENITAQIGVDGAALREEFYERRRNTIGELSQRVKPRLVGEAYGLSPGRTRQIINEETAYDARELAEARGDLP